MKSTRLIRENHRGPSQYFATFLKWFYIIFFLVFTLLPLLWLFISSFKTNIELQTRPFALPEVWQFSNYLRAIQITALPQLFFNSVIVSTLSSILSLLISSMGAFVFARENFRGKNLILNLILAGVLVPIIALMAPYLRIITTLRIYDSLFALILTYSAVNIPISTFLMYGFMRSIPKDLENAAVIDGANLYQRFWHIVLPLSRSGMATAGTFIFLFSWNEFIYALLLTSSPSSRTIQLGIRFFVSQFFTDYTSMFAAIIITIIPSILVYVLMHERIISGLTSAALKE